jgi:hypothetical protein
MYMEVQVPWEAGSRERPGAIPTQNIATENTENTEIINSGKTGQYPFSYP